MSAPETVFRSPSGLHEIPTPYVIGPFGTLPFRCRNAQPPHLALPTTHLQTFLPTNPLHALGVDLMGGDSRLGHSVIYFEPEMQFYYYEPIQKIYKPTTPEKLQNYYRAMMLRCAQELTHEADKLNLFVEFRSDKNSKAVVNRAKSILAADHSFFSPTSPHQRIRGPELHERLIRVLVETMLEKREGACLTVTQAYDTFCRLAEQRQLGKLKRSMFRELMRDCVRESHGLALRNDVPDHQNHHQQAWKGLAVIEAVDA